MQSKKKMIVNTVFLVVIFALTIYGVFHGEDLGAMMEAMRRADVRWLLPELLCVVFFIWGESITRSAPAGSQSSSAFSWFPIRAMTFSELYFSCNALTFSSTARPSGP